MSRSAKNLLKNIVLVAGSLGVIAMAWLSLVQILRADPFSKFALTGSPVGAEIGVTLTNFTMKAYETGRLAAEAKVESVEVRRDRSQFAMSNVSEGKFYPADADPLGFDMKTATYHYFQGRLMAEEGAHATGKDFDLDSDTFVYDENVKTLLVRGQVQGKLAGGAVKADDFSLVTSSKVMSATNVLWIGQLDELTQDGQRKQWEIFGKTYKRSDDGKTQYYTQARATDGEVIVLAENVEYTKETDVLVAKGSVKYYGVDANMLCDQATVYRKERRAVFTGVVRMVVKSEDDEKVVEGDFPTIERVTPESLKTNPQGATQAQIDVLRDTENVRKYPIKVIADKIEYWYSKGERRAVITGSPFARQDLSEGWRLGWAPEAFYDGEAETLKLVSKAQDREVKLYFSIGDQYQAVDITLSTKEGDKSMSGNNVLSKLFVDDEEVPVRSGGGTTGGGTGGR